MLTYNPDSREIFGLLSSWSIKHLDENLQSFFLQKTSIFLRRGFTQPTPCWRGFRASFIGSSSNLIVHLVSSVDDRTLFHFENLKHNLKIPVNRITLMKLIYRSTCIRCLDLIVKLYRQINIFIYLFIYFSI